ncbi:protoporphyrinogen/coproporphyrinogen oxidase [Curtobacterium ammoniigenes]|uniref:protoporphyrinogen/coproporphyrinogen oxidase n=1 Tax=Curtobacterium ammoniigenes TaxID=395387 RepID=UPI00082EEBEC|nr:FAD-dependent oxidoreductase [Curtobacterium ammoniigenes]
MTDVIVVGGGVAGLVAARDLAKGGVHVTLLEADAALGGMVQKHTLAGIDLDLAAESFATRGDHVRRLAIELGLGNELVEPDKRGAWVMTKDRRVAPLPAAGLLGIPSTPMAADVIAVVGTSGAVRAQMDSLLPATVGAKAATLGELVRRRMGQQVLDDLVVPVAGGVHSTHPDQLDLDRVVPGLRAALLREGSLARAVVAQRAKAPAGSAVGGIRGGISRLVDELAADMETYHVDVRLGMRAVRIDAHEVDAAPTDPATGRPGPVERLHADAVLSTVADPGRQADERVDGIELVTLVVDQPELDAAPRGTGMLVHPDASGIGAKALTHATVKWAWLADAAGGRHVLRLSYALAPRDGSDAHGAGSALAVDPSSELAASAVEDAAALLGVPLRAEEHLVAADRVRWRAPDRRGADLAAGVVGIGEVSVGRGLAGVVAASRTSAERILDD